MGILSIVPFVYVEADALSSVNISASVSPNYWGFDHAVTGTVESVSDGEIGIGGIDVTISGSNFGPVIVQTDESGSFTASVPDTNTAAGEFSFTVTTLETEVYSAGLYSGTYVNLKHRTVTTVNPVASVQTSQPYEVIGLLNDVETGRGIPNQQLTFTGSGVTAGLSPSTTNNPIEIKNNVTPLQVSHGILLAGAGTEINLPSNPFRVNLVFTGTNTITVEAYDKNNIKITTAQSIGQPNNQNLVPLLSSNLGISRVVLVSTSSPLLKINSISASTSQDNVISNIDFTNQSDITGNSLLFDSGRFVSSAIAQTTESQTPLTITVNYAGSANRFEPSSSVETYEVGFNPNSAGGAGAGTVVVADSNNGITSILCAADNDSDGDALCNDWEGGVQGTGVPYTINGVQYRVILPGTSVNQKDLIVENDYMLNHQPDATALQNVKNVFANNNINLINIIGESIPHNDLFNVWIDSNINYNDDFGSIKSLYYGSATDRVVFSPTQTNTVNPNNSVSISGVSITTPTNQDSANAFEGRVTIKVKVTPSAASSLVIGVPTISGTSQGLTIGTITTSQSFTGNDKIITIKIPISSTAQVTGNIGTINVPLTWSTAGVTTVNAQTYSPSPTATSNKQDALAQAQRYALWVHSIGGSSGQSELPGNDLVIALGSGFGSIQGAAHPGGTINEQAGTYMHELGHILGLNHGGPVVNLSTGTTIRDNAVNCKPNNSGVMPYSRQLTSYLGSANWKLDYSHGTLGTINESTQSESLGITPSNGVPVTIVWSGTGFASASGIPLNWNLDPDTTDIATSGSQFDVNNFGIYGCTATLNQAAYSDYDDWANLKFNFRSGASGQFDGSKPVNDLNAQQVKQIYFANPSIAPLPPMKSNGEIDTKAGRTIPIHLSVKTSEGTPIKNAVLTGFALLTDGSKIPLGQLKFTDNNIGGKYSANFNTDKIPKAVTKYGIQIYIFNQGANPEQALLVMNPAKTINVNNTPTKVTFIVNVVR